MVEESNWIEKNSLDYVLQGNAFVRCYEAEYMGRVL